MKTIIKILSFVFLIFLFTTCRKEIKEPPSNTRNDNFVYIEIDGEKFMVEDRSWNLNRNTKGNFEVNNSPITVTFQKDSSIEISFSCQSVINKNTKKNYLSFGCSIHLDKRIGLVKPRRIGIGAKCFNTNSYFDFTINREYTDASENTSFKNCKFELIELNEKERTISFKIKGLVENYQNNKKLVPVYIYFKLKNTSKF